MLVEKFGNRFNFQFLVLPSFLFLLSLVETRPIETVETRRTLAKSFRDEAQFMQE